MLIKLSSLYFILFFIDTAFGQDPSIVDEIFPDIKRIGETGRLNCTVVRLGNNVVTWTHQPTQQLISRNEKISLDINEEIDGERKFEINKQLSKSRDRITYMLIIRNLQNYDAGNYICSIQISGKDSKYYPKKIGVIIVLAPPKIQLSLTTTRVELKIGQSFNLKCNATGNPHPNITWVRANGNVLPTMEHSHRGSILRLVNIQREDQGVYRCVADNTVRPPAHLDAQVLVISSPLVSYVQNTVGQAQNGKYTAILECRIASHPSAELKWYKRTSRGSKEQITDNDKYEIQKLLDSELRLGETWYYLKVKNIQANDYGEYSCVGVNYVGKGEAVIKLFETFECQGPNCPSPGGRGSNLKFCLPLLITLTFLSYLMSVLAPSL